MLEVIITKEELYDKCENVEQLYDGFYYPLLVEYKELKKQLEVLEQENQKYKEVIDKANKLIYYNIKYRNGADIYQFVDIESEILEPLKYILEQGIIINLVKFDGFGDGIKEVCMTENIYDLIKDGLVAKVDD